MPDKIKTLYDAASKKYNLGSEEDFRSKIQDKTKAQAFYSKASKDFNLGDFDSFYSKVSPQQSIESTDIKKKSSFTSFFPESMQDMVQQKLDEQTQQQVQPQQENSQSQSEPVSSTSELAGSISESPEDRNFRLNEKRKEFFSNEDSPFARDPLLYEKSIYNPSETTQQFDNQLVQDYKNTLPKDEFEIIKKEDIEDFDYNSPEYLEFEKEAKKIQEENQFYVKDELKPMLDQGFLSVTSEDIKNIKSSENFKKASKTQYGPDGMPYGNASGAYIPLKVRKQSERRDFLDTKYSYLGIDFDPNNIEHLRQTIGGTDLGNRLLSKEGLSIDDKKKINNHSLRWETNHIKTNPYFDETLFEISKMEKAFILGDINNDLGDWDKSKEAFKKQMNERGVSYLSPDEIKTKEIFDKFSDINNDDTLDEETKSLMLSNIKKEYEDLTSNGKILWDPSTGKFVRKGDAEESVVKYNNKVNSLANQLYSKNDLGTLISQRDSYMLSLDEIKKVKEQRQELFKGHYYGSGIAGDVEGYIDMLNSKEREYESMSRALNKAIFLNRNPVDIDSNITAAKFERGFLGDYSDVKLLEEKESFIRYLSSQGIDLSDKEKEVLETGNFAEKAGGVLRESAKAGLEIAISKKLSSGPIRSLMSASRSKNIEKYGGKIGKIVSDITEEMVISSASFSLAGAGAGAGVGEGLVQGSLTSAGLDKLLFKGKFGKLKTILTRSTLGTAGETVGEFTGEFIQALGETGFDFSEASEQTFGKSLDEFAEKLALTTIMAGPLSLSYNIASVSEIRKQIEEGSFEGTEELRDQALEAVDKMEEDLSSKKKEKQQSKEGPVEVELNPKDTSKKNEELKDSKEEVKSKTEEEIESLEADLEKEKSLEFSSEEVVSDLENKIQERNKVLESEKTTENVQKQKTEESGSAETISKESTEIKENQEGETDTKQEVLEDAETKAEKTSTPIEESFKKSVEEVSAKNPDTSLMANKTIFDESVKVAQELQDKGFKGKKLQEEFVSKMEDYSGGKITKEESIENFQDVKSSLVKSPEIKVEEKVKAEEKVKNLTKAIRSKKIRSSFNDLSNLQSNPVGGVFEAVIDGTLETVAKSIEVGAKTVDAVSSGINYMKKSDWYKKLSDDGKLKAEKGFREKIEAVIKENESTIDSITDKPLEKTSKIKKDINSRAKGKLGNTGKRFLEGDALKNEKKKEVEKFQETLVSDFEEGKKTQKEIMDSAESLVDDIGYEEAFLLAEKQDQVTETALRAAALNSLNEDIKNTKDSKELSKKKSLRYKQMARQAQRSTDAGRSSALNKEIIERYSHIYHREISIAARISQEKEAALERESFDGQTNREAIEEIRSELEQKVKELLETKEALEGITKLANKYKSKQPKKSKTVKTFGKTKQEIDKGLKDSLAKLKKASQSSASSSFLGFNSEQIEALGEIGYYVLAKGANNLQTWIKDMKSVTGIENEEVLNHIWSKEKGGTDQTIEEHYNEKVKEKNDKRIEKELTGDITQKRIKELTGKTLLDIVKMHYVQVNNISQTLAQKISEETGLSVKESKRLEKEIKSSLEQKVKERVEKVIERKYKPTEKKSEDQKRIARENRQLITKVVHAVNMGVLKDESFTESFSEKMGFASIDTKTAKRIEELVDFLVKEREGNQILSEETISQASNKKIDTRRVEAIEAAELELNNLLDSLKPNTAAKVAKTIVAIIYRHVLSGINSLLNSNLGGLVGSLPKMINYIIQNPVAFTKSLPTTVKSLPASWSKAVDSVKKGRTVDTRLGDSFSNASHDAYTRAIMVPLSKRLQNIKDVEGLSEKTKEAIKFIGSMALKIFKLQHLMNFGDAFLRNQYKEFHAYRKEYQKAKKELKLEGGKKIINPFSSKLNNKIHNALQYDNLSFFEKIVDEEIETLKREESERIDKEISEGKLDPNKKDSVFKSFLRKQGFNAYKRRRVQELLDSNRNEEVISEANELSKDMMMLVDPDGILGTVFKEVKKKTTIKDTDSWRRASLRTLTSLTMMFPRVMFNAMNNAKTGIPIYGMFDALIGVGKDKDGNIVYPRTPLYYYDQKVLKETGEIVEVDKDHKEAKAKRSWRRKYHANKHKAINRMVVNLMTTSVTAYLISDALKWDDEEEKYVLDKDRMIDARMNKYGFVEFSVFRDKNGKFTNYYSSKWAPEFTPMLTMLAKMSEDVKSDKKDVLSVGNVASNLFNSGYSSATEGSFNFIGNMKRTYNREAKQGEGNAASMVMIGLLMDPIKNLGRPLILNDITKEIQSELGVTKKTFDSKASFGNKVLQKLSYGMYGLDFWMNEKTDAFGNTYKQEGKMVQWGLMKESHNEKHKETKLLEEKWAPEITIPRYYFNKDTFNDAYQKKRVISLSLDEMKKLQSYQQEEYKELFLKKYDKLEEIDTPERFKKEVNKIKRRSVDQAKKRYVKEAKKEGVLYVIKDGKRVKYGS